MDKISEGGKKMPLLVVGEVPSIPAGAVVIAPAELSAMPSINNFYIVLAVSEHELAAALPVLAAAQASPNQVIVHLPPGAPALPRDLAGFGALERLDGEHPDEFRARLLAKMEAQRQKKLPIALTEAHEAGIARRLSENELMRTLEIVRVAHALACGFVLAPCEHRRALRASWESAVPLQGTWAAELALERLIPETAATLVDAFHRGASPREALRERAAGLSFRARTNLLHVVENWLGALLGGKHAA